MKRETSYLKLGLSVVFSFMASSAVFGVDTGSVEKTLLPKAMKTIKKVMRRATQGGTPYFVSCKYTLKEDKTVAAKTEVRYLDYRKEADRKLVQITPLEGTPDGLVEFVYKPKSETLTVVYRDPKNPSKRLATQKRSGVTI